MARLVLAVAGPDHLAPPGIPRRRSAVPFRTTMTINVVLAEDNALLRQGVERLLERTDGVALVRTVGDLTALLNAVDELRPDVVVTDIKMPPTHTDEGITAATALRASHPTTGVVVLSQYVESAYAVRLLAEGSDRRAYLLKERLSDVEELVAAIQTVAAGGSIIDPKVVEALVEGRRRAASSPLRLLTRREHQVLAEMASGKSNAAIAAQLVLTERAVEKYTSAIFSKLSLSEERDTNRRVKAVLLYLQEHSAATG